MKFKSIRFRLILWYVLILGIIILIADFFLYNSFKKSLIDSIDNTLYMLAEEVEHTILKVSANTWRREIKNVRDEFLTSRFFIQVLEIKKGKEIQRIIPSEVLAGSVYPESKKDILLTLRETPEYLDLANKSLSIHPIRVILFPVEKEHVITYIIQVGTPLTKTYQALEGLSIILLIAGPFMLILSSLGGFLILGRAINPVKSVVQAARQITTEDLAHRIDSKGREDEIGELIQTFNQMISRLQSSVERIKEFSSDVSHELKTPLTIIRGEVEVALRKEREKDQYKEALLSVHEEAKRLENIIDNLLFLSHIDFQETQFTFEKTPFYEVLINELQKIQQLGEKKNLKFIVKEIEALYINGDSQLLKRLITNLIDNAIKYTPPGGEIEISLHKHNHRALLEIRDTGIGIPKDLLPFIFDRFFRVDKSRVDENRGSGLGLSIVKRIAELHGAKIKVDSQPNRGTRVSVFFPLYTLP